MRDHSSLLLAVGCILLFPAVAAANDLPPWSDPADLPIPPNAASVVAADGEVPVFLEPSGSSARRGVVAPDFPLPLFAMKRGPGCAGRWINIGPLAWVCQDKVRLSASQPISAAQSTVHDTDSGLPFDYFFVGVDGARAYSRLRAVDQGAPDQDLERGFAVAIVEQRSFAGQMWGRTRHGMWIAMSDLVPVRPPTFHGQIVTDGTLDFAWVVSDNARVLSKPAPQPASSRRVVRFQLLRVLEEKAVNKVTYLRFDDGAWISAKDVARPSLSARPVEVQPGERWIDIELASQTLVAYEGDRPVFATLVSTGRGAQRTPFATPVGVHRIWVKLIASTMDNLENDEASEYYSIEDVPYVQYFSNAVGLHATFWHNRFGHVRSHGCVNLTPRDAQWLFGFTGPHLPAGWTAVFPNDLEPSTVVRVR